MIKKINSFLRGVVLLLGAIAVVVNLTAKDKNERKNSKHGYQSEEFDDIW